MKLTDFTFKLPDKLIAHYPLKDRTASKMLALDGNDGEITHCQFKDLVEYLNPGDLLVFNDTRVIPARLYGFKETGGKVEVLIERLTSNSEALAHIKASKSPKVGTTIELDNHTLLEVIGREDSLYKIKVKDGSALLPLLEAIGHIPLPPYIDRPDEDSDKERYQTVYSKNQGAVAAPTAGLHFDESIMQEIKSKGIEIGFVTLHVGAGTFQPVRVDDIKQHKMHSEWVDVSEKLVAQVDEARERKSRIVAIGTTSVRCLESAYSDGKMRPYKGFTDIFIYPGYRFNIVDCLVTNFHLSESTLLMLVSAFAGKQNIITAYQSAIDLEYRFFSYGDVMFINKNSKIEDLSQ